MVRGAVAAGAVVIGLSTALIAVGARAADPAPAPEADIVDLTAAFTRMYDAAGPSDTERLQAFTREIEPLLPGFYGLARFNGQTTQVARDRQILRAFERFPALRETYTAKAGQFRGNLAADMASFRKTFPDFKAERPIYLLHSLGEMDGGTRLIDGAPHLIFGADGMAQYHEGFRSESPFFHHELFHIYHQPKIGACEEVWCTLWIEGLAVHVAATLNPGVTEAELLLDFPPGLAQKVRANLPAALAHAKRVLDSKDMNILRALFSSATDKTGLLPRRGYVIGYLLVQDIGRDMTLGDLADMPRDDVRAALILALERLSKPNP